MRDAAERTGSALDPADDVHATAAYRRHLAGVLLERALRTAHKRARAVPAGSTPE